LKPTSFIGSASKPSVRTRVAIGVAIGVAYGLWTVVLLALKRRYGQDSWAADFTHPWIAARALLHGANPYQAVYDANPPFGQFFLYPLPAALLVLPLSWIPLHAAAGAGVGIAMGLLAFAVTKKALWPLLLFLSAPALRIADSVQIWSPLFTAAALLSPILGIIVAKPHAGLPVVAFQSRLKPLVIGAIVGAALLGLSFVVHPQWFAEWWNVLHVAPEKTNFRPPILNPLGVPLLLAALRWKRPEARLLLASSLLPQSPYFYDQLCLLLIPGSRREMLIYAAVSQVAAMLAPIELSARRPWMIAGLYLPALFLVLRRASAVDRRAEDSGQASVAESILG
jgi:hypothetical protein